MRLDLGSGPNPAEGYVGVDASLAGVDLAMKSVCLGGMGPPWPEGVSFIRFDLASGNVWPFADESVEELRSSHFIEHVPACDVVGHHYVDAPFNGQRLSEPSAWQAPQGPRDALVWVFEEAWRIAKPGALFHLSWPSLYDERTGAFQPWAFADPTHRRFLPKEWLHYLSTRDRASLGVAYDWRCNWVIVEGSGKQNVRGSDVREIVVDLRKEPMP